MRARRLRGSANPDSSDRRQLQVECRVALRRGRYLALQRRSWNIDMFKMCIISLMLIASFDWVLTSPTHPVAHLPSEPFRPCDLPAAQQALAEAEHAEELGDLEGAMALYLFAERAGRPATGDRDPDDGAGRSDGTATLETTQPRRTHLGNKIHDVNPTPSGESEPRRDPAAAALVGEIVAPPLACVCVDAVVGRAFLHWNLGDFQAARDAFRTALKMATVQERLGSIHRLKEACSALDSQQPTGGSVPSPATRLESEWESGSQPDVLLEQPPQPPCVRILIQLASLETEVGNLVEAASLYRQVLSRDPYHSLASANLLAVRNRLERQAGEEATRHRGPSGEDQKGHLQGLVARNPEEPDAGHEGQGNSGLDSSTVAPEVSSEHGCSLPNTATPITSAILAEYLSFPTLHFSIQEIERKVACLERRMEALVSDTGGYTFLRDSASESPGVYSRNGRPLEPLDHASPGPEPLHTKSEAETNAPSIPGQSHKSINSLGNPVNDFRARGELPTGFELSYTGKPDRKLRQLLAQVYLRAFDLTPLSILNGTSRVLNGQHVGGLRDTEPAAEGIQVRNSHPSTTADPLLDLQVADLAKNPHPISLPPIVLPFDAAEVGSAAAISSCLDKTLKHQAGQVGSGTSGLLRVGFVAQRLSLSHSIGKLLLPMIRELANRETFPWIQVTLFVFQPPASALARTLPPGVIAMFPEDGNLAEFASLVASRHIDVLVFTDVSMSATTYLASLGRLATTQLLVLNNGVTSGSPNMDYYLSEHLHHGTGGQDSYVERLVLFPPHVPLSAFCDPSVALENISNRTLSAAEVHSDGNGKVQPGFSLHTASSTSGDMLEADRDGGPFSISVRRWVWEPTFSGDASTETIAVPFDPASTAFPSLGPWLVDQAQAWGKQNQTFQPEDSHIFAVPHMPHKFHPAMDKVLAQVLLQVPGSWLAYIDTSTAVVEAIITRVDRAARAVCRDLRDGAAPLSDVSKAVQLSCRHWLSPPTTPEPKPRNVTEEADNPTMDRSNTVGGTAPWHRQVILPRLDSSQFLGFLASSTAVLDTWPFGGGVTSRESLSVGTPVVTLPSSMRSGRITESLYRTMDIGAPPGSPSLETSLVADTPESFVAIARKLALDVNVAAGIRQAILDRKGSVFSACEGKAASREASFGRRHGNVTDQQNATAQHHTPLSTAHWWAAALCYLHNGGSNR